MTSWNLIYRHTTSLVSSLWKFQSQNAT